MAARRWVRPTEALGIGFSAWLLFSCTSDTSTGERTAATSAALNNSPNIGNFVLYAERSIDIGSHDQVTGGDLGIASVAIASFGDQLIVSDHAQVDQTHNLLSPSVTLGSKSQVGDVQTNALHNNGAQSLGTVAPYPGAAAMPPVPIAGNPASSMSDVSVAPQETTTLSPGAYGALNIADHAHVTLAAGMYSFSSVSISDHVQVAADAGGVTLLVGGQFSTTGWDQIQPTGGAPASALTILVGGVDGPSASPPAARLGQQTQLTALIAAPRGTLSVAAHSQITGALAAFDLSLADHVQTVYQSGFSGSAPGQHGMQQLTGYVTPLMAAAPLVGPVPPDKILGIDLAPVPQDAAGLKAFVQDVSDPGSANFRKYKGLDQITAQFAPTRADAMSLSTFATTSGLTVLAEAATNILIFAQGTAQALGAAFHVNFNYYLRPDGTQFFALDQEPSVNLSTTVYNVSGLHDYFPLAPPFAGTGPGANFAGVDFDTAYFGAASPCATLNGNQQVIGLLEFDSINLNDVSQYQVLNPTLPPTAPGNVQTIAPTSNPWSGTSAGGQVEATLDAEMAMSAAPGAQVLEFNWPNDSSGGTAETNAEFEQILGYLPGCQNQIGFHGQPACPAGTPTLNQFSISWPGPGDQLTTQFIMEVMAGTGVSIFISSGDFGAYNSGGQLPIDADLRWLVANGDAGTLVGGTNLTTTATGAYVPGGESAWNGSGGGIFSGGPGVYGNNPSSSMSLFMSDPIGIPTYQTNNIINNTVNNQISTMNRNVPDVSAVATNLFAYVNGQSLTRSGTSYSAPLWAGFAALVNQQANFNGVPRVGPLNPTLYGLAGLPGNFYSQVFNDVTTGSNGFNTTAGYDLATGLGTPTCNLLNQVASTTPLIPIGTAIPTPQVPVTMAIDYGCALQSGKVECWGGNVAGQLGNGGTASTTVATCTVPLRAPAISVEAGTYQTCALLSDGSVWCWGQNDYGQLGVGSINTGSTSPVQVHLPSGFFATSLGVGPWFACAVGQTGSVMCWGKNDQGQLGSTTSPLCAGIQCAPTPQQVQSVVGATSVSAGDAFACAGLMGGAVDCWGADDTGQIGNGTFSATPLPPTRVAGIASAQAISAGVGYACALSATGSVSCWGANDAGQLGNGNTTTSATPQATPFSGVKYVAAGFDHTCVVDQAGVAACVGDNNAQDLGNAGLSGPQTFPVTVRLPFPATGVATGNQATCAIMAEGSSGQPVACWGSGANGQLGDGSTADSPGVPVDVALQQCP